MLYWETIAVCSEIPVKHVNKADLHYRLSPYRAVNTLRQGFKNPSVNAVWETLAVCSEIDIKHVNKTEL
jgi:2-oxoglutarate dehydrogenase complex dehydrogenase (E1) component-like enzyme